jgi:hypothetical protein
MPGTSALVETPVVQIVLTVRATNIGALAAETYLSWRPQPISMNWHVSVIGREQVTR